MIVGIDEITDSDYAIEVQAANWYLEQAATYMKPTGLAMGCQRFTSHNLRHLVENLDKLRMLCTQPDAGQRGNGGVRNTDLEFIKAHICVEVMQAYLSGNLVKMPVDKEVDA